MGRGRGEPQNLQLSAPQLSSLIARRQIQAFNCQLTLMLQSKKTTYHGTRITCKTMSYNTHSEGYSSFILSSSETNKTNYISSSLYTLHFASAALKGNEYTVCCRTSKNIVEEELNVIIHHQEGKNICSWK